jgi:hypothetical protein
MSVDLAYVRAGFRLYDVDLSAVNKDKQTLVNRASAYSLSLDKALYNAKSRDFLFD